MENDNINKQMEELLRLFKKLMEKYPPDSIPGMDKAQAEHLKMMLSDADNLKVTFSPNMFGMFDEETMQKILGRLIGQLREQLGEDAYEPDNHLSVVDEKEKDFEQLPTRDRYVALIDAIDAELKRPDITMEEIDNLLDKRRNIQDSISNN